MHVMGHFPCSWTFTPTVLSCAMSRLHLRTQLDAISPTGWHLSHLHSDTVNGSLAGSALFERRPKGQITPSRRHIGLAVCPTICTCTSRTRMWSDALIVGTLRRALRWLPYLSASWRDECLFRCSAVRAWNPCRLRLLKVAFSSLEGFDISALRLVLHRFPAVWNFKGSSRPRPFRSWIVAQATPQSVPALIGPTKDNQPPVAALFAQRRRKGRETRARLLHASSPLSLLPPTSLPALVHPPRRCRVAPQPRTCPPIA